jgi:Copper type II ascorbate-dependent monooxygenase, C-terminal domain
MIGRMRLRQLRPLAVVLAVLTLAAGCGKSAPQAAPAAADAPYVGHHSTATIPPPQPLRAGERFEAVNLARPYQPKPPHSGTDEYRCFLIDPHIATPTFLTGSQFLPQNNDIVHHAIVYRVDPADVAQAKALDDHDPGDGWTCFGGTGVRSSAISGLGDLTGGSWIGAWAPGASETLFTANVGYPLAPGSQLVLQIHYNLLETNGKAGPTDESGVRLRLHDGGPGTLTPLNTLLVAAPIELPCTSAEKGPLCDRTAALADLNARFGAEAVGMVRGLNFPCNGVQAPTPGDTQHCDQKVTSNSLIYSVAGHMHLLGKAIKVELNPGTPNAKVLLDLPQFNFDDQGARPMATPVAIKPGDTLRVTCTYDASLRSKLPELKPLQPRYVMWGDGTSDEMCLAIMATARTA